MRLFPKIIWEHLGKEYCAAEYYDFGFCWHKFRVIRPFISLNIEVARGFLIAYALFHELGHYFCRWMPEQIESCVDICWDVTTGRHDKEQIVPVKAYMLLNIPIPQ
jgi:hypothetical protein